jgi:chaperonin cofactor prefoldin
MSSLQQLQLAQKNLQHIQEQKQQLQSQLIEIDSALTELKTTKQAYRILGKIMVATSSSELQNEVQKQYEQVSTRLSKFTKQEETAQKSIKLLQQDAMKEMKK